MRKIIKNSFNIIYSNIILVTLLLLFFLIISAYVVVSGKSINTIFTSILFYLTFFLMISAFIAGWFNTIKQAIFNFKQSKKNIPLMSHFTSGVADYIIPYSKLILLLIIFLNIFMALIYYTGIKIIGPINIPFNELINSSNSYALMQEFVNSLSKEQIINIFNWYTFTIIAIHIFCLFTLFWPIEIMYSSKKVIKSLFESIINLFKYPKSILLFVCISIINFIMMIFYSLSMFNDILYAVMTIIYFYFITCIFVLLFVYYDEKIKSNSDSITDSNGQNSVVDKVG